MKQLKLVVVLMSVSGLISAPAALATTQTKHKGKKTSHHMARADYKAMGGLPVQPAPVAENNYELIYDAMGQNLGRAMHAAPDWMNRVSITGGANFDAHWGNRSQGYNGENNQRLSINDVYLNTTASINDWTKAFASVSFNNATGSGFSNVSTSQLGGVYSNGYANNRLDLEQGYVTISNFATTPFFVQVGKQFADFGAYSIHPITRTLAQSMSESLQTSAKVGFITEMGLNGQVYAFDNNLAQNVGGSVQGHTKSVYGASLGFAQPSSQLGYNVGVGYMSNLTGVNDIAASIAKYQDNVAAFDASNSFTHTVGGVAIHGDVNSGPFTLGARYVTAIQNFSASDLSTSLNDPTAGGAKPWAADITAGVGYNAFNKNQNVYLGYQASGNAVNLLLPKSRWMAGIGVDMWKNTTLGLEVAHDVAYSTGKGGTGNSSNTIGARAAVKFG